KPPSRSGFNDLRMSAGNEILFFSSIPRSYSPIRSKCLKGFTSIAVADKGISTTSWDQNKFKNSCEVNFYWRACRYLDFHGICAKSSNRAQKLSTKSGGKWVDKMAHHVLVHSQRVCGMNLPPDF